MPQFPFITTMETSEVLLESRGPASFLSVREGVRDTLQELSFLQYRDKQSKVGHIYLFCRPWEEEDGKDQAKGLLFLGNLTATEHVANSFQACNRDLFVSPV